MKWSKTSHLAAGKNEAKAMSCVDAIRPERAADYARKMFEMRVRGWGDETDAIDDVAGWCQMSPRSFKRLIKGVTKDPGEGVLWRVRRAYLKYCADQAHRLLHDIEIETRKYGDDAFEDLGAKVRLLVAEVEAAKNNHTSRQKQ